MHLPERALLRGRLGRLGRELRVRVDVVERQVPPHVADVAEVAQQLADDRLGHAAVRALEVAVLDQRDGRVHRARGCGRARPSTSTARSTSGSAAPSSARIRRPLRQQRRRAEDEPGHERRAERGAEDAELRLVELRPVERERRDQQRDREADARRSSRRRRPPPSRPAGAAARGSARVSEPRRRRRCRPACRRT